MQKSFFALGRVVLESQIGSVLRYLLSAKDARREELFLRSQAKRFAVRAFTPDTFRACWKRKPDANTFFILGSGNTVNDLSEVDFAHIGEQRSAGINNWPLHRFVPDFFSFESAPRIGDGGDLRRAFGFLERSDILSLKPPLLVLRPGGGDSLDELAELPPTLRDRVHFYGRVTPVTRREENLKRDVRAIVRTLRRKHSGVFVDSGATVIRLIHLAATMGFSKIVLVGVDLSNSRYFWEQNPDYRFHSALEEPVNNQQTNSHETMSTDGRPFSVVDMVAALGSLIEEEFGAELYVGSQNSLLARYLPVYAWENYS